MKEKKEFLLAVLRFVIPPLLFFLNLALKNMHVLNSVGVFTSNISIIDEYRYITLIISVLKLSEFIGYLEEKESRLMLILDWLIMLFTLGSTLFLRLTGKIDIGLFIALIGVFVFSVLVSTIIHRTLKQVKKK